MHGVYFHDLENKKTKKKKNKTEKEKVINKHFIVHGRHYLYFSIKLQPSGLLLIFQKHDCLPQRNIR